MRSLNEPFLLSQARVITSKSGWARALMSCVVVLSGGRGFLWCLLVLRHLLGLAVLFQAFANAVKSGRIDKQNLLCQCPFVRLTAMHGEVAGCKNYHKKDGRFYLVRVIAGISAAIVCRQYRGYYLSLWFSLSCGLSSGFLYELIQAYTSLCGFM